MRYAECEASNYHHLEKGKTDTDVDVYLFEESLNTIKCDDPFHTLRMTQVILDNVKFIHSPWIEMKQTQNGFITCYLFYTIGKMARQTMLILYKIFKPIVSNITLI